jgi:DNA-binding transcriptional MerR regulator
MYRAHQFAQLAGVTIRTLHHYDKVGLLRPRRLKGNGYRVYEDRDLERLEQVVALKYLGMSLRQIGTLLASGRFDLKDALRMQKHLLVEKRRMLDRAIRAIGAAERSPQPAALKKIFVVF